MISSSVIFLEIPNTLLISLFSSTGNPLTKWICSIPNSMPSLIHNQPAWISRHSSPTSKYSLCLMVGYVSEYLLGIMVARVAHASFPALVPFESPDSSVVSSGELVVNVASPSHGIALMIMYLLVGHLHVDHLVIRPHSVSLLFSLTVVNVGYGSTGLLCRCGLSLVLLGYVLTSDSMRWIIRPVVEGLIAVIFASSDYSIVVDVFI
eukprot:Gb_02267 [translate_table: standard]